MFIHHLSRGAYTPYNQAHMVELPLFPLEMVLFPGTPIHLFIFEPRYRLMMRYCIDEQRPFGVALIRRGLEAGGELAEPYAVGCTARITSIEPLEEGRMNLAALGEERFRILELDFTQPYLVGKVEGLPIEASHSVEMMRRARRLGPWVLRYLAQVDRANPDNDLDLRHLQLPDDPLLLACWAAALLQIPAQEKQPLLEAPSAGELLEGVLRLFRRETTVLARLLQTSEEDASRAGQLN
jgi:Lon protease-like protein